MRRIIILACLGLTACATPQQQCIAQVTRELTVVDALIADLQGTLTRGYALVKSTRIVPDSYDCTPAPTKKRPDPRPRICERDRLETYTRGVAVNLDDEAAKLASLQRKRTELAQAAAPAVQACQIQYPEPA